MKPTSIIHRLVILLITLMSAISANAAEAYACYTSGNTTLTFYYDNQRSTRSNTYNLNTDYNDPGWESDGTSGNVTKVVFDSSFAGARPTSTYSWFYNMANLQSVEGMNYLNTSEVTNMAWMFGYCSSLTSLDLSSFNTAKVTDMDYMFNSCTSLQTIYAGSGWITNTVSSSTAMFSDCTSLVGGKSTNYDKNHVDKTYAHIDGGTNNPGYFSVPLEAYACYTPSNTTLTFYYDNQRTTHINTYDLNTSYNDPGWLSCTDVTKVVFDSSFADARPTSTYSWFYNMDNLQSIEGMNYLNTSEVTNMSWMFGYCKKLTSLDLGSFNTARVTDMDYMFNGCTILQIIYVGSGWRTSTVSSSTAMFSSCWNLEGGKGTTFDTDHVDNTYAHIDGGTSNPGYLTDINLPVAYACYTPSNTTLTFYYDKLRNSRSGTTYDMNKGDNDTGWDTDDTKANVTKVVFDPSFAGARPTTTYGWFFGMKNLESITGLSYLNSSEVTNMGWMFSDCFKLTTLDLSSFNTSKVVYVQGMFYGSTDLQTIYVGDGWSTAAVTESNFMFDGCIELRGGKGTTWKDTNPSNKTYAHVDGGPNNPGYFTDINSLMPYVCYTPENTTLTFYYDKQRGSRSGRIYDLNTGRNETGWDTDGTKDYVTKVVFDPSFAGARPTTTCGWFALMLELQTIEGLSYLNTSEVTNMSFMFLKCYQLTSIDVSHFNTSKVITMNGMFFDCRGLTSLDLSSFNTSKVSYMVDMFWNSSNLRTIHVGNGWSTAAVTDSDDMFTFCTNLVGGQGTNYNDSNPKDKTYAHIDGGTSNPGYLTYKKPSGIATDLHQVTSDKSQVTSDEWYTIDGRKLNGKPAAKGVYIQNGKKTVVK